MRNRTLAGLLAAAAALMATGCSPTSAAPTSARQAPPAVVAAGAPVDCVQLTAIERTRVWGDDVIDFHMRGGKVYRNTLPMSCPNLGFEQRFSYKTTTGQLCSIDTIAVLPTGSSIPGPTCGLGKFQPVTIAP
jgi:hypothetical protein